MDSVAEPLSRVFAPLCSAGCVLLYTSCTPGVSSYDKFSFEETAGVRRSLKFTRERNATPGKMREPNIAFRVPPRRRGVCLLEAMDGWMDGRFAYVRGGLRRTA